jgi:hypothetical protein
MDEKLISKIRKVKVYSSIDVKEVENDIKTLSPMPENVKTLWLEALSSNKYEKNTGSLKTYDTVSEKDLYDVFGVLLQELLDNYIIEGSWHQTHNAFFEYEFEYQNIREREKIPEIIRKRFGIKEYILFEDNYIPIQDINDTCEITFEDLYTIILENF